MGYHLGSEEYKCPVCGKTLRTENAYKEHVKGEMDRESQRRITGGNADDSKIDNNRAKIRDLTILFADGKISEESYLDNLKTLEKNNEVSDKNAQTLRKLDALFREGKISEGSYKTSVEALEKRVEKPIKGALHGGTLYDDLPSHKSSEQHYEKPSGIWYLLPLFLGFIGALIGYVGVRDRDRDMANNILLLGIAITVLGVFFVWAYYSWLMSQVPRFY